MYKLSRSSKVQKSKKSKTNKRFFNGASSIYCSILACTVPSSTLHCYSPSAVTVNKLTLMLFKCLFISLLWSHEIPVVPLTTKNPTSLTKKKKKGGGGGKKDIMGNFGSCQSLWQTRLQHPKGNPCNKHYFKPWQSYHIPSSQNAGARNHILIRQKEEAGMAGETMYVFWCTWRKMVAHAKPHPTLSEAPSSTLVEESKPTTSEL